MMLTGGRSAESFRRMVRLFAACFVVVLASAFPDGAHARGGSGPSGPGRGSGDERQGAGIAPSETKTAAAGDWGRLPLYGGEIISVALDPSDPSTVFAGSRGAGVFKSTDGGGSWIPARGGLTYLPIRSLAVDPVDPRVLYAGTDFEGIWKSTDGGGSWSFSGDGLDEGMVVFNIVVDPEDPDVVYAGLAGGVAFVIGNVFRSDDGGESWTAVNRGMAPPGEEFSNGVRALALDPDDPSTVWAGTTYEGVFRSANAGADWEAVNDGVPTLPNSDFLAAVNALAVDHHRSGRALAVIGGDLFELAGSEGWQQISPPYVALGFGSSQLVVHPVDDERLYATGGVFGLSVSEDGGASWEDLRTGCDRVAVDPAAVDTLYCTHGADGDLVGGVHRSTDGGQSWSERTLGIDAVSVSVVAADPTDEDRLYAGGDGYLYRSDDGGETWSRGFEDYGYGQISHYLGTVEDIAVDPADPATVWVAASGGLMRSVDSGETLEAVDSVDGHVEKLAFAVSGLYAGTGGDGVIFTFDGGGTWRQGVDGFPVFGPGPCPVLSLEVDERTGTVWAGTQFGGGLVRSTDGGLTWQSSGLTEHNFVDAIAVNPDDSSDLLAGAGSWSGGIYRSRDGGATWDEVVADIAYVYDFVHDPVNPGHVYAATDGYGVLRSTDGGDSWTFFSDGIFHPRLRSMVVTAGSPPRLVTGSLGSGLYWRELAAPVRVRRSAGRRSP